MCHRLVGKKKLEKDGDKVMEARHKKKGKRETVSIATVADRSVHIIEIEYTERECCLWLALADIWLLLR